MIKLAHLNYKISINTAGVPEYKFVYVSCKYPRWSRMDAKTWRRFVTPAVTRSLECTKIPTPSKRARENMNAVGKGKVGKADKAQEDEEPRNRKTALLRTRWAISRSASPMALRDM